MTTKIQKTYLAQRKAIHEAYGVSGNVLWAAYRADCTADPRAAADKYNAQKDADYEAYLTALDTLRTE